MPGIKLPPLSGPKMVSQVLRSPVSLKVKYAGRSLVCFAVF